ncbi:MAG: protein-L-isoaspartate(D-aspartate) O-methyltransferase [Saccharofermentanales bacterium]
MRVMKNNDELYKFYTNLDRSLFIDNESSRMYAQCDSALPIECGQTISQPSLVYSMTSHLDLDKNHKVLEIGTGSGYQTAFLSEFSGKVYTVERIPELAEKAKKRLHELGFENIEYHIGDGSRGWPENAPYDRIMVTAAAGRVPDPLIAQLAPGGKMVIPVGEPGLQELLLIEKDMNGTITEKNLGRVIFVELKGDYGWSG